LVGWSILRRGRKPKPCWLRFDAMVWRGSQVHRSPASMLSARRFSITPATLLWQLRRWDRPASLIPIITAQPPRWSSKPRTGSRGCSDTILRTCSQTGRAIGHLCDIPYGTLFTLFARWTRLGLWGRLLDRLRRTWRLACGDAAEPTAVVIDSRSCRSAPSCFGRGCGSAFKVGP
jgi:hypothetical protein